MELSTPRPPPPRRQASPRHRPGSGASAFRRGACRSRSARPGRNRSDPPAARCRRHTGNTGGASSFPDPPGWQTQLCLHRRSACHTGKKTHLRVNCGSETSNPNETCIYLNVLQASRFIFMALFIFVQEISQRQSRGHYLLADGPRHGYWEGPDHSPAQVLSLPLLTELAQLLLAVLVQGGAVLGLQQTQGHEERQHCKSSTGKDANGLDNRSRVYKSQNHKRLYRPSVCANTRNLTEGNYRPPEGLAPTLKTRRSLSEVHQTTVTGWDHTAVLGGEGQRSAVPRCRGLEAGAAAA